MMSPDPPRDERNNSTPDRIDGEFIVNWDDMDGTDEFMFVPEGPYELDMGGSESEYSDDDDDVDNQAGSQLGNPSESENPDAAVGSQARGYYQLLIPFPAAEQSSSSDNPDEEPASLEIRPQETSEHSDHTYSNPGVVLEPSPTQEETDKTGTAEDKPEAAEKREINLTEDKVETIISVMKGFTLPQASIPNWAVELDEDSWKKRLSDKINTKVTDKLDQPNAS